MEDTKLEHNRGPLTMFTIGALILGMVLGYLLGTMNAKKEVMEKTGDTNTTNTTTMDRSANGNNAMDVTDAVDKKTEVAEGVMVGGAMMVPNKDIVDNAANASNVSTLVNAVKAAGLVEALKGDGPLTVFAPVNEAFDKLPSGTVDTLLQAENKEKLQSILKFHVVSGRYLSSDLKSGMVLTTLQGDDLTVGEMDGKITINGTPIMQADVISSNGIIHLIDTVLMPSGSM